MTFTSLTFLLFLPVVFALYWGFPNRRWQNLLVVLASYLFYGWWDWRFCSLMLLSSTVDYGIGRALDVTDGPKARRAWIILSLAFNLGMLGFFKYFNFFAESLIELLNAAGLSVDPFGINIVLPVGISFYTFQSLSYTIDVYRRDLKATRSPIEFLAFVSFFPQLVAGPIERATRLLPQFQRERRFDCDVAIDGLRWILWGFFKKLAIADRLAPLVNDAFHDPSSQSGPQLVLATFCFAFQIYCDFSAYSDIAVGTAKQFDIHLMQNFNYPYFATSIGDFWRRWHISLSTWMRDYVYVPLGGSRGTTARWATALFLTFLISGLWHGAAWHFVVWGLIHGVAVLVSRLVQPKSRVSSAPTQGWLPNMNAALGMATTFGLVCFGWIFFRAENLADACTIVAKIAAESWRPDLWTTLVENVTASGVWKRSLIVIAVLVSIEWSAVRFQHAMTVTRWPGAVRWAIYTVMIWTTLDLMPRTPTPDFIYFQF